jgi:hypothetical protein
VHSTAPGKKYSPQLGEGPPQPLWKIIAPHFRSITLLSLDVL